MSFDAANPGARREGTAAAVERRDGSAAAVERREGAAPAPAPELGAVIEALPLGVFVFGADGRLAACNHRAMALLGSADEDAADEADWGGFGDLADRLLQRAWMDRQAPRRLVAWAASAAPRAPLAVALTERDGRNLDARAVDLAEGGFLLTLQDVAADRDALRAMQAANAALETRVRERHEAAERAREAAERASAAKTRFLVAAGHDLLQPLNAARLFLDALQGAGLDAGQAQVAGRLGSALDSVDAQIAALIDIARFDSGEVPARRQPVPLGRLFDPLRDEFGAIAAAKGLELRVAGSSAVVDSDPALLRRVLQNLVSNAVRYTVSGRVLVGVRRRADGRVALEVRDTGPGIAPEWHAAVFEEFRRLGPPDGDQPPGMGLGLAIVQRACALLGHALEMQSAPGRGTCFRVIVPLQGGGTQRDPGGRAARAAVARAEAGASAEPDLRGMSVLVLAAEGPGRAALLDRLAGWGAAALAADGLAEAAEALAGLGGPPEAVLATPRLPDGAEGLELIRTLRAWFGPAPAALLARDHRADPDLGREAEFEDVDTLPPDDEDGALRAALAVMRGG